ncbi:MAG TPA: SPOR domain-containing protein [Thermoanaerobaculia bacterium]|nr:SPOR domain-containing protein [Thermoanaerobaculia bacterium]
MAESHEPSYYEIALTNRQVVVAFVILLTCLLSAFFSGVWIGRESTARAAEEQIVRNTPPQAPKDGQNLEELEFFDQRNKTAARDETPAPEPSADTTLVEDVSGRRAAAEPSADEEPVEENEPAARPAETTAAATPPADTNDDGKLTRAERRERRRKQKEAAEAAAAAQKAAAAPKPAAAEPKPASTRTSRAAEPSVPRGSVVIQVFSSSDQGQADRIRTRLTGGGYKAYLSPVEKAGHTMYRVRIGPFSSRDDAQKVAEKVRKGYKLDTWVTE